MNVVKQLTFALIILFPSVAQAELHIVATLPALGQIAQAVAGDDGEVRVLARVGEDPHFVPPKPTLARHLARADLLITAGLALESGWLPPLIDLSRNPKIREGHGIFVGADHVKILGVQEHADRSMGDVHPEGNPHWWLDPVRVAQASLALGKKMASIDPENKDEYLQRAELFSRQLIKLSDQWSARLNGSLSVVTYHDSYRYFVERFGVNVVGFIEPKPGVEPSTRHLDDLIQQIAEKGAKQIWVEPYHHGRVVRRVASLSDAQVIVMPDAAQGEGAEGYLALIRTLLHSAAGEPR